MPDTTDIMDGFAEEYGITDDADTNVEFTDTESVDDTVEEDTTAEYTEDTETDAEDTTEAEEEETPETIDYSYNHKTTALPLSAVNEIAEKLNMSAADVIATLQKGSNYDTLNSRQTPYAGAIDRINRFATANGISKEDAIARTLDAIDVIESARYIDEIKAQYPDAPVKMVQDMALMKVKQNATVPVSNPETDKQEEARREMWKGFFTAHPDVTADNLSERMLQALETGENPEVVYMSEQNASLQKQIKDLEAKQNRTKRSTGSSKKTAGNVGRDAFLDAFLD